MICQNDNLLGENKKQHITIFSIYRLCGTNYSSAVKIDDHIYFVNHKYDH